MDDLISRQAAIDALKGMAVPLYKDPACEDIWERDRTLDNAIDAIRGLPSVQPEAKPPKWVAEDRYVKNRFAVFPHCPRCNAGITTGQCYCMICGQHIDWSEDDG